MRKNIQGYLSIGIVIISFEFSENQALEILWNILRHVWLKFVIDLLSIWCTSPPTPQLIQNLCQQVRKRLKRA